MKYDVNLTGWTNVNLLYFSDSIKIASLKGLSLCCPAVGIVMHDFHGLRTMTFHHIADIAYFLLAVTEIIQFFSLNVTTETCSKT